MSTGRHLRVSPFFMGAARSAGGWRDSICLQDSLTGCRQRRVDSLDCLVAQGFRGCRICLHGFAEAMLGKEFLVQSARAYARARA